MKKLLFTLTFGLALLASPEAFAQAKKKEPAKPADAPAAPAAADDKKPADAPAAKAGKPAPMNAMATEVDAAGKTFTHVTKDGKRVKHTVTDATTIMQGEAAAKFEDIKVGDQVSGLRNKKNAEGTEYEVVKITKFGPKAPKKEGEKPAAKPAEAPAKKAE